MKWSLMSIEWPTSYPDCSSFQDVDVNVCKNSTPVVDPSFYDDLVEYLSCKDESGSPLPIDSLDTKFFNAPKTNNLTIRDVPGNGTFCDLSAKSFNDSRYFMTCEINEHPNVGKCYNTKGSHSAMFFTYLFLRVSQAVFDNTMFSLLYGTGMHLAKQHNGDISMVVVWNSVAGMIGPLIAAALVVDPTNAYGIYFDSY